MVRAVAVHHRPPTGAAHRTTYALEPVDMAVPRAEIAVFQVSAGPVDPPRQLTTPQQACIPRFDRCGCGCSLISQCRLRIAACAGDLCGLAVRGRGNCIPRSPRLFTAQLFHRREARPGRSPLPGLVRPMITVNDASSSTDNSDAGRWVFQVLSRRRCQIGYMFSLTTHPIRLCISRRKLAPVPTALFLNRNIPER